LNFLATVVFLAVLFLDAAAFFGVYLAFLIAMNSPDVLFRYVQVVAPPIVVFVWLRFFTAPLRALSRVGLLAAMPSSSSPLYRHNSENQLAPQEVPGWPRNESVLPTF
jgi:hypothetical protein